VVPSLAVMSDPLAESSGASRSLDLRAAASDELLLLGARRHDEDALGMLYDRYGGLVFTLALRIVGDRDLAEEVMQDAFLRCWNSMDQFDGERGTVASWLMGITRNRAIDVLRGRQHQARLRENQTLPEAGPLEPGTPDSSDDVVLQQTVGQALAELTDPQRQAIELAYYAGLTQAEVAERLGEPLGTVKTRMRDGLRRLRRMLSSVIDDSAIQDGGEGS
jgi:RNA polymerase sigma-70 factor (ECF subfamily)